VLKTWRQQASVLGLIDLPPPLVDRVERVTFFDRNAYFPPSLLELAARKSVPVYVFMGQWDAQTLQPRLDIVALNVEPAQPMLQAAITTLETAIRNRPGAWHGWGDAGLYFQPKQ
jgi:lauroyl/myristoyl acyltransferase